MPRTKTGVVRRQHHKKVIKMMKGQWGSRSRLFKRADRWWVEFLEDEDDEQDHDEDRCADADVHVLPLVALWGAHTHGAAP